VQNEGKIVAGGQGVGMVGAEHTGSGFKDGTVGGFSFF
jgi:hypothetical protein